MSRPSSRKAAAKVRRSPGRSSRRRSLVPVAGACARVGAPMGSVSADSAGAASRGSIAQVYRSTLKREDIFFNIYVTRPPAAVIVYLLQGTRVAPNQVTFFSLLLAPGAAFCFCGVEWPLGLWLGVGIYELSYVFDKVDGMLARCRGVQSA